jgi:hypothetical protein
MSLVALIAMAVAAYASEGGASVYPAGVETVVPGLMPASGGTLFLEFDNFYQANELAGPTGHALLPGFHLRVGAAAVKLVHNWGLHVLGGTLVSTGAIPALYMHLDAPFGSGDKTGFGNADAETLVAYRKGSLHWWYGFDVFTPGFGYHKDDLVNIGQHNYATAPAGAFSYLPRHGKTELSSRVQYIVNYTNDVTHYRSGREFLWEFDGMQNLTRNLAIGGNGYYYQQVTDDLQNGAVFEGGNRGRNVTFGPEIRCHFSRYGMILKYQKDFLTQNRTVGNSFWFQVGMPIGHPHHD